MGQTLSEPVTAKITTSCSNDFLSVGASCMQGWRINMEDAHTHILDLDPNDPGTSFFAVYDGHGSDLVANYASKNLHHTILAQPCYRKGNVEEAIKNGFLQCDQNMFNDPDIKVEFAGTTAIAMLIKGGKLYIGNVGDSRAVACWAGRTDPLSQDHKPNNANESNRITAAGGWVEFDRVNGNLALSRALGDFVFKQNSNKSAEEQIVTALPDVQTRILREDLEFVVLACDGIWDVMTNEEVVQFIRCRIAAKMQPSLICEELMTHCLAPSCVMGGLGCDNMTVLLICFLHGKSYEDLSNRCSINTNHIESTDSSDSLASTSCSTSTPETRDGDAAHNSENREEEIGDKCVQEEAEIPKLIEEGISVT